jgi:hypothetical protein
VTSGQANFLKANPQYETVGNVGGHAFFDSLVTILADGTVGPAGAGALLPTDPPPITVGTKKLHAPTFPAVIRMGGIEMTPAQISWLNANTAYVPLCQAHPSYVFTAIQSIDVTGGVTAGATIVLPQAGPLSGCENTASIVVGKLVKVGT